MKIGFNNRNNQGCLTEKITSLDGVVKVHKKSGFRTISVRNVFTYKKIVLPTVKTDLPIVEIYFTCIKHCFTYNETALPIIVIILPTMNIILPTMKIISPTMKIILHTIKFFGLY